MIQGASYRQMFRRNKSKRHNRETEEKLKSTNKLFRSESYSRKAKQKQSERKREKRA